MSDARKQLMNEIIGRGKLNGELSYSETNLQQFGEIEKPSPRPENQSQDPGVQNESILKIAMSTESPRQRRTLSQPGPVSGSLLTATAARAARRRPNKNVMYADPAKRGSPEKLSPRNVFDAEVIAISDRDSPIFYNNGYKTMDSRSMSSYRLYTSVNDLRSAAPSRKRSVMTMDAQSIRSMDTIAPPPTAPEVKKKKTTENMTTTFSCIYAIFLVTFGLIVCVADAFMSINLSTVYGIILSIIGFLYMIYIIYDIGRYKKIALKNEKIKAQHVENIEEYFSKQDIQMSSNNNFPEAPNALTLPTTPVLIPLTHDYCFSQGRHSGSFYLKLGAAVFSLGHLVHSLLLITYQIGLLSDEYINNEDCVNNFQLALDCIAPTFSFVELYFVFKFSNVIILKNQSVARFGFMHLIGSSLCFWLSTIAREAILGLTLYAQSVYSKGSQYYSQESSGLTFIDIDVSNLYNENCIGSTTINSKFVNFSPYLYPFSIEINILIVAVYYIIWSNIGNCDGDLEGENDNTSLSDCNTICKIPAANEENDFSSNIVIHADCHKSNKGLFLGLIVTVITIGMLIIGYAFSSVDDDFLELGYLLTDITKLFLHVTLLGGVLLAYKPIIQLDINEYPISLLDDILLFICLPAFFLETTMSLVATVSLGNIVKTIDFIVMVIQVTIQTALIADGLRRCSNSKKLRRTKPGREVIMFLIITNVAMWLFHTFCYKSPDSLDERYTYYGKVLWTILGHISLPLMMFYRFHSSVCFADIWDSAYKPGSDH